MAIVRRLYNQARFGNPYEVQIRGNVAIGASGAVGAQVGLGFSVVKEAGAGTYTVTLDAENGLIEVYDVSASVIASSTDLLAHVTAFDLSAGTFTVVCETDGGVATNPASGARLCFRCVVKNKAIKF
jgi:hypothetical protein